MAYTISYLQNSLETGSEHWTDTLAAAQDRARTAVALGAADRVEVRDETGSLVFHHPE